MYPSQGNWEELQEWFRTEFSKLGSSREQLFHAWIILHFDENAETIDAYVQRIRQVAAMLNYHEPQILEVFKMLCLQICAGYYSQLKTCNRQWQQQKEYL